MGKSNSVRQEEWRQRTQAAIWAGDKEAHFKIWVKGIKGRAWRREQKSKNLGSSYAEYIQHPPTYRIVEVKPHELKQGPKLNKNGTPRKVKYADCPYKPNTASYNRWCRQHSKQATA